MKTSELSNKKKQISSKEIVMAGAGVGKNVKLNRIAYDNYLKKKGAILIDPEVDFEKSVQQF